MKIFKRMLATATSLSVCMTVGVQLFDIIPVSEDFSPIAGIIANAEDELLKYTSDDGLELEYKILSDNTIEIVKYINSTSNDIYLPYFIDGKLVTSIGGETFYNCSSLTSVTIPDSVTSIGENAFVFCTNLTSVIIPNSVTSIGYAAFYNCTSLESVTISDSVTSIGENAFAFCTSLTSVKIPDSMTSIECATFQNCSSLTSVIIPDGVKNIEDSAFLSCKSLTSVTIPDSVTGIGDYAFNNCRNLTTVTIPESVTSIGIYVFSDTKWLAEKQAENPLVIINGILIDAQTCSGDVVIPESVKSIGSRAFSGCESLTSITIPDSMTSIGNSAFYNCTGLTSVTIPNSVASIGNSAFSDCTGLTSVTIPDSVTSIEYSTFSGCTSLTSMTIPESVTNIEYDAFSNCINLTEITIYNPFCQIYGNEETISDNAIIYCYECSNAMKYASAYNKKVAFIPRPQLNYTITEIDKSHTAKINSVKAEIDYSTISDKTTYYMWPSVDKLQECKDSKGNIYAIYGKNDFITLFSENADKKPVTIANDGFTFGSAVIDESDNLYVFWGYNITDIDSAEENTENIVIMKYDMDGNILGRCGIPLLTSDARYPFDAGNASMAVKDNIVGCFFNIE